MSIHFKGESSSPNFWEGLIKKRVRTDRFSFFWRRGREGKEKRSEVSKSGWDWYPGGYYDRFSESNLWRCWKKVAFISQQILYMQSQRFWSFMKFYFVYIVKVYPDLKNSRYAYIPLYMHKTLPTFGNKKKQ